MKKIRLLSAGIACAVSLAIGASAAGIVQSVKAELRPDFEIVIDGEKQTFKNADGETVYPILYEGTTYLPVRAIGEMMGKTVYWYQEDKRIELKDEKTLVTDADVIITDRDNADKDVTKPKNVTPIGGISLDKAKQIALDKASLDEKDVVFTKTETDRENGVDIYEIEFRKDRTEYSADIRISDGTVISWEVEGKITDSTTSADGITLDEAKKIALDKAGLKESEAVFTEAKPDKENGVDIYEIEFKKDGTEYSADIRVSDGAVLSWEVEAVH